MKKQVVIILFLTVVTFIANAQNVHIPDSNFKALLIGNTSINTNGDTEIQKSEAEAFRSTLFANSKQIEDLTGVEAFINITGLSCFGNKLTSLDVSKNTKLTSLRCYMNQLTAIDVSNNLELQELACHSNQISSLDVSKNTKLKELNCYTLKISLLDLTNNPDLEELNCSYTDLTDLNIPFPEKLKKLDISGLDSLATMDLSAFSNLQDLGCASLDLTSLDISNLPNLTVLNCSYNLLTSLDLSNHLDMVKISCGNNEIAHLDVSSLTKLRSLYASDNKLKSLDVSNNTLLQYFRVNSNDLTELNLANGNNENIRSMKADRCPELTCIQVDRKSYADSNWMDIDETASFSEDCGWKTSSINQLTKLFAIYPNPTSEYIYSEAFATSQSIIIYNAQGKEVKTINNTSNRIDISDFSSGTYTVLIISKSGVGYNRFLKL